MVTSFRTRQYPAGREVKPRDQSLPNADTPISNTEQPLLALNDPEPTDVPPAGGDPTAGGDPNSTPTATAPSPDVPTTTDVPVLPMVIPDPSPDLSNPQPTTTDTPGQDAPPPEPTTDPNQGPINQDQQSNSDPGDGGPTPDSGSSDPGTQGDVPASSLQSEGGYIPSSTVSNSTPLSHSSDPQPTTTQTISNPPASSIVTLPTNTLQATPTALSTQGGALSTGLSDNKKYIIGGAAGGGVLLLILLVLLLVCCRKRRVKRDLERAGGGHHEEKTDHGQFSCCDYGTCNGNNGQTPVEHRTPLRPFALRSDPVALTTKEVPQLHAVSLRRRDSAGSQKSAGSDTGSCESEYSDSPKRNKRGLLKRPPPLKLTSLVTPVINGPQDNPRDKAHVSTLSDPSEIPTIVVESPRSETRGNRA